MFEGDDNLTFSSDTTKEGQPILPSASGLYQTQDECESIIRQLPDPLIILSKTGKIISVSGAFEKASGYKLEEIAGKNLFAMNLVVKESFALVKKNLLRRFLGQEVPLYDVGVRTKDGRIRIAEVNGAIIDFRGKKSVLVVFRDVTDRRMEMEKNTHFLKDTTMKLEEKLMELEKMNELMVGRELKMVELKDKLEKLGES